MGSSGPLSIQQTRSPLTVRLKRLGPSPSSRLLQRRPEAFLLPQSAMARPCSSSIPCISRATGAKPQATSGNARGRTPTAHSRRRNGERYSGSGKVVTVIAGDFNTDPTDARFASEQTFALLREKFVWLGSPVIRTCDRPGERPLPDACFDGSGRWSYEISPASRFPSMESATISRSCSQSLSTERTNESS